MIPRNCLRVPAYPPPTLLLQRPPIRASLKTYSLTGRSQFPQRAPPLPLSFFFSIQIINFRYPDARTAFVSPLLRTPWQGPQKDLAQFSNPSGRPAPTLLPHRRGGRREGTKAGQGRATQAGLEKWSGPARQSAGLSQKLGHTQDAPTHPVRPAPGSRDAGAAVAAPPEPPPCSLDPPCCKSVLGGRCGRRGAETQAAAHPVFVQGGLGGSPPLGARSPTPPWASHPDAPEDSDPLQSSKLCRKLGEGWVTRTMSLSFGAGHPLGGPSDFSSTSWSYGNRRLSWIENPLQRAGDMGLCLRAFATLPEDEFRPQCPRGCSLSSIIPVSGNPTPTSDLPSTTHACGAC